jgi:hypothetical protein
VTQRNITARNATDLLQVADFTGLLQVVNTEQVAAGLLTSSTCSLLKSGLLQVDICRLDAS